MLLEKFSRLRRAHWACCSGAVMAAAHVGCCIHVAVRTARSYLAHTLPSISCRARLSRDTCASPHCGCGPAHHHCPGTLLSVTIPLVWLHAPPHCDGAPRHRGAHQTRYARLGKIKIDRRAAGLHSSPFRGAGGPSETDYCIPLPTPDKTYPGSPRQQLRLF